MGRLVCACVLEMVVALVTSQSPTAFHFVAVSVLRVVYSIGNLAYLGNTAT